MKDYNTPAKVYWWSVTAAGAAALLHALAVVLELEPQLQAQIVVTAAVAAFVGLFPVRILGTKMSITGGEIFIFLALLVYGVPAAVIAAAVDGAVASWRTSRRLTSRIGTPAMVSLAMLACGSGFELAREAIAVRSPTLTPVFPLLLVFGWLYFAANTGLTSLLLALKRGDPIRPLEWWAGMRWIGVSYMASATIAGLLFASFERFGFAALVVSAPMIAMFLYTLHTYFARREADERHMRELQASESRFHSAFNHAAIGMALIAPDGNVLQANRSFCEMLGRRGDALVGTPLRCLVAAADAETLEAMVKSLVEQKVPSAGSELRGVRADEREVWMAFNMSLSPDWQSESGHLILQAQDVTARRQAEAELYHNAFHDALTGLANRKRFDDEVARAIARLVRRGDQHFAVMYLDLDRFKMVNDSLGHRAGDELLVELGRRLLGALRPTDLVARLGGDEFAVFVDQLESPQGATELAERIQRDLVRPFELGGMDLAVTASIGITFSSNGYRSAEEMLRDADIAMYQAKSQGKARYALFDSSQHRLVAGRLKLESQLRRALAEEQLFLLYQPVYSLEERALVGFEALVRWRHPEHGVIDPGAFIPTAEETGLIVPLGKWVLEEACRQLQAWAVAHRCNGLRVSVNVSGLQLRHPDFVSDVQEALARSGLLPAQLLLEVTETVLMESVNNGLATLERLHQLGVALAIDDFGTGYSSLNYLATLPIDALKVDRSFIERLAGGGDGSEIARAIFKLGAAISKQVFAEGIETDEQLDRLLELGCPFGQGYLFSRPIDGDCAALLVAAKTAGPRRAAPARLAAEEADELDGFMTRTGRVTH